VPAKAIFWSRCVCRTDSCDWCAFFCSH